MAIAQVSQKIATTAGETAKQWKDRGSGLRENNTAWTRPLAVGALATGAVLLARGRRKAGFAAAAAGTAIALLENPEELRNLWENIPTYIERGTRLLNRLEGFVDDLSSQGARWKSLLKR